MTNTPRALLIEDYQAKCAKMEDDMLGWKESAEAWERDARGLSDRLKMLEALAREPGSAFDSVERILDDESAWVSRPSEAVSLRIALAAMMKCKAKYHADKAMKHLKLKGDILDGSYELNLDDGNETLLKTGCRGL